MFFGMEKPSPNLHLHGDGPRDPGTWIPPRVLCNSARLGIKGYFQERTIDGSENNPARDV